MSMQGGDTGFHLQPPAGGQGTDDSSQQSDTQFFSDFIKNIPEEDKPAVQRYLGQIQGGVTQGYQKIHDQYRPYKELGVDVDTVKQALSVWEMLDQDPRRIYNLLKDMSEEEGWEADPTQQQPPQPPEWQKGLPQEFTGRFDQMEKLVMAMGQEILQSRQAREESDQDQQLEDYLDWLNKEFGSFDERWVLSRMDAGVDGPKAVQEYRQFEQSIMDRATGRNGGGPTTPRVLGGAGSVAVDRGIDLNKASDVDIRKLVVQRLADSARER